MTAAATKDWLAEARAAGEECRQHAHRLKDLGFSITVCCPADHVGVGKGHECDSPGKRPLHAWKQCQEAATALSHDEIDRLYDDYPLANLGAALGEASGLVRVDADGEAGERKLREVSGGLVPSTWEFASRNGRGLLYRIPRGIILKTTILKPGEPKTELRFQAKGAQTVLPPSRHPKGGRYTWKSGCAPWERDAAEMPAWLVEQLRVKPETNGPHSTPFRRGNAAGPKDEAVRRGRGYVAKMPPAISGQGGHNQAFSVACKLVLGFDLSPEEALPLMLEYNERCEPVWTEAELVHKLDDADKQPGVRGYLLTDETLLTDRGNAIRLIQQHGADLRHVWPWKKWLVWDGSCWRIDQEGAAVARTKDVIRTLYRQAVKTIAELEPKE